MLYGVSRCLGTASRYGPPYTDQRRLAEAAMTGVESSGQLPRRVWHIIWFNRWRLLRRAVLAAIRPLSAWSRTVRSTISYTVPYTVTYDLWEGVQYEPAYARPLCSLWAFQPVMAYTAPYTGPYSMSEWVQYGGMESPTVVSCVAYSEPYGELCRKQYE